MQLAPSDRRAKCEPPQLPVLSTLIDVWLVLIDPKACVETPLRWYTDASWAISTDASVSPTFDDVDAAERYTPRPDCLEISVDVPDTTLRLPEAPAVTVIEPSFTAPVAMVVIGPRDVVKNTCAGGPGSAWFGDPPVTDPTENSQDSIVGPFPVA